MRVDETEVPSLQPKQLPTFSEVGPEWELVNTEGEEITTPERELVDPVGDETTTTPERLGPSPRRSTGSCKPVDCLKF